MLKYIKITWLRPLPEFNSFYYYQLDQNDQPLKMIDATEGEETRLASATFNYGLIEPCSAQETLDLQEIASSFEFQVETISFKEFSKLWNEEVKQTSLKLQKLTVNPSIKPNNGREFIKIITENALSSLYLELENNLEIRRVEIKGESYFLASEELASLKENQIWLPREYQDLLEEATKSALKIGQAEFETKWLEALSFTASKLYQQMI